MQTKFYALALTALALSSTAYAQDLKIHTYLAKPEHFGVTSTLIEGDKEVMLVNAQFSKSEALRIAAEILDSGKTLKTIFVSYGDPDFYFGLDVFKQYFPNVKIIATPETVQHIQATQALKVQYWGPQMGVNAPSKIIVPEVYTPKTLTLEDEVIAIKGQKELTYLWIPSAKAVVGGIPVSSGIHLWMADTPSSKDRAEVVKTLESIKALQPEVVIPAHMQAGAAEGLNAVNFSIDYLKQYEKAAKNSKNSAQLIQSMQQQYPDLAESGNLALGAKVVKSEMKWP
ncbi:MBL fold metallo-hydrolase [Acinetobacter tandoii]|uniref:MBL fold metallo-hydrolase n=1 Tax=Acinetobacter tandoii TaxID=202954 RepID=A0A5N4W3Z2_9GAMM|nr:MULTISPECIES: MBL fold metallo-hydrolase [Acinetobacter]AUX87869.1 MBL fold metallo-hydrolase [Acinetobacter sp. ACNIH2]KAB1851744.1 MBL fold metallo-hydrolase [Acinetobacter tandoii]UOG17583.1 MBL fold metallo-hydrolase [Acinetobacter sp. PK01]